MLPATPPRRSLWLRAVHKQPKVGCNPRGLAIPPVEPEAKEIEMDWNIVEGNWKQFKGKVKTQWGKLTDDHLDVIAGKRDQLAGKIQESYGITKDEAEKQIKDFEERNKDARP